ncbi:PIG-L deacetylase family protein [Nonomuraea sp. NPDC050394]|uniref:PIG-L deacetylase family protein n=1 Tax=Nonomuraea sp. NPDC050394 TaxID=3364363 RepID=UPI00378BD7E8
MKPGSNTRIDTETEKHAGARTSTIVVSPHPDDAVLSCWGVLSEAGVRRVVTVFAGVPEPGTTLSAWDRLTRAADPRQRATERHEEDRRALALAGCAATHLPFAGAAHRRRPLDRRVLETALEEAMGDAGTVYAPAAIGGHPDHVATRDAVLAASAGRRLLLYADQPYAVRFGWPSWVTGRPPRQDIDVDGWFAAQLESMPGRLSPQSARVRRLSRSAAAAKSAAVREYRSQFAALVASAGPGFPDGPAGEYEVFWPL